MKRVKLSATEGLTKREKLGCARIRGHFVDLSQCPDLRKRNEKKNKMSYKNEMPDMLNIILVFLTYINKNGKNHTRKF